MLGLGLTQMFSLKALGATDPKKDVNCIMLMLVGAPSQLDTWDMKPNAPAEIRGPFKPIKTNVPGIDISENFPRMAKHADKYSIVRSMYHTAAAVHDTGHQMMQTGRLFSGGIEHPHMGCVLSKLKGPNGDVPAHVLLPRPIGNTGGNMPHGQNAGFLGKSFDPFVLNADPSDPNFRVPDMLPPDYLSALRVDRRKNWRSMVDKSVSMFETSQDAPRCQRRESHTSEYECGQQHELADRNCEAGRRKREQRFQHLHEHQRHRSTNQPSNHEAERCDDRRLAGDKAPQLTETHSKRAHRHELFAPLEQQSKHEDRNPNCAHEDREQRFQAPEPTHVECGQ